MEYNKRAYPRISPLCGRTGGVFAPQNTVSGEATVVEPWTHFMGSPFFTKHALEKFEILANHGFFISQQEIIDLIGDPDEVEGKQRNPFVAATKKLQDGRVVRVMYKVVHGVPFVITFYPIRKKS